MHTKPALAAIFAVACGTGTTDDTLQVAAIVPSYAPLAGGTRIVITGQGFLRDGAPPNRVVIGTTEAPLAAAASDTSLEVEVPPGDKPGDVPVLVFNRNGSVTATGMFHYSTGPKIASMSPRSVVFDATNTTVTVTGTGFLDEDAGVATVTIDDQRAIDVKVVSDTELTFTTIGGPPLRKPVIKVTNQRGVVGADGFRFVPGMNEGLILFTHRGVRSEMALYYDPANNVTVPFTQPGSASQSHFRTAILDPSGDYWAVYTDRAALNVFGKVDFRSNTVENPIQTNSRIASLVRVGDLLYAVDRQTGTFGSFNATTGQFTKIGAMPNFGCCQRLVTHNNTMYLATGNQFSTIDPATGTRGTIVTLTPFQRFGAMKFVGNTLYAVDANNGDLFTVNPSTGAVSAAVAHFNTAVAAMEVFEP